VVKLKPAADAPEGFRPFVPTVLEGSSGLSFRRLRKATPLPNLSTGAFGRYLARLNSLFGGR